MTTIEATARRAARRAYEIGRARLGMLRGLLVTGAVTVLAVACAGTSALAWMPLTWLVWASVEWRGGALRAGAVRGLAAGAVTLVLPVTWLRVCCAGMERGAACSAPQACAILGALIGCGLAASLPEVSTTPKRVEAALGAVAGVLAVSGVRCASLLRGEALGLVVGLAAGLAAGAWIAQRRAATI